MCACSLVIRVCFVVVETQVHILCVFYFSPFNYSFFSSALQMNNIFFCKKKLREQRFVEDYFQFIQKEKVVMYLSLHKLFSIIFLIIFEAHRFFFGQLTVIMIEIAIHQRPITLTQNASFSQLIYIIYIYIFLERYFFYLFKQVSLLLQKQEVKLYTSNYFHIQWLDLRVTTMFINLFYSNMLNNVDSHISGL